MNQCEYGFEFKNEKIHLVFGNKNLTLQNLNYYFPHYEFSTLKQTHSSLVVETTNSNSVQNFANEIEADAHFTHKKNIALIIKTADCIPLLGFTDHYKTIFAIHAGWRGVVNEVSQNCFQKILLEDSTKKINLYFGPSITQKKFCVDKDVFDLILNFKNLPSNKDKLINEFSFFSETKYWVNLEKKLSFDLQNRFSHIEFNLQHNQIDTVEDIRFNSYRRDKEQSKRNISFIVKL